MQSGALGSPIFHFSGYRVYQNLTLLRRIHVINSPHEHSNLAEKKEDHGVESDI
jgi:hypothetical protein